MFSASPLHSTRPGTGQTESSKELVAPFPPTRYLVVDNSHSRCHSHHKDIMQWQSGCWSGGKSGAGRGEQIRISPEEEEEEERGQQKVLIICKSLEQMHRRFYMHLTLSMVPAAVPEASPNKDQGFYYRHRTIPVPAAAADVTGSGRPPALTSRNEWPFNRVKQLERNHHQLQPGSQRGPSGPSVSLCPHIATTWLPPPPVLPPQSPNNL